MQIQKKNLWLVALAGALTMAFVGGCPGEGGTGSAGTGGTGAAGKTVEVSKWEKVAKNAKFVNNDRVDGVIVSEDGNWAYFASDDNKALKAWNVGGETNFVANLPKDAQWEDVTLTAPSLAGGPGLTKLAGANKLVRMVPTKEGAMFSVKVADNSLNGVSYVKGKTHERAWQPDGATATHILNNGAVGTALIGGVLKKNDGGEHPYLVNVNYKGSTGAALSAAAAKLDQGFEKDTNDFTSFPYFINGNGKAMAISADGVSLLTGDEAAVGTAANFTNTQAATAKRGSDLWKIPTKGANTAVKDVVVANNKLYIGLGAPGADAGGVAVYDIATDGTKGPDAAWNGVNVVALTKDGANKVWAVTPKGLIEAKDDGTQGTGKIDADVVKNGQAVTTDKGMKNGYEGKMPDKDITGAAFVGKHLIVTTSTDGIHVMTHNPKVSVTK